VSKKQLIRERFAKDLSKMGIRIRKIREKQNISQEKLAIYAGVPYSSVNEIEAGKTNPTAATLMALAEALNVEVKEFF